MASGAVEQKHDLLVRCIGQAYESLSVMPGLDANGPVLVWFADHLLGAHERVADSSESR